jgi:hypothetical protein
MNSLVPFAIHRAVRFAACSIAFAVATVPCAGFAADADEVPVGTGLHPGRPVGLVAQADDRAQKSRADSLLSEDNLDEVEKPETKYFGFDQFETAYTYAHPAHWSKLTNRFEIGAQGAFSSTLKWKLSGRFDYNAIYDLSNFYPQAVKTDDRFKAMFRETYLDWDAGAVDFRFGAQQIVWGEVVGLFFADVVSAKDLRETVARDFDILRIPQWAARAEYFKNDFHVEGIWIPVPTVNRIGRPGSDFFPYPPAPPAGYGYVVNNEEKPTTATHENVGLRASVLRNGYDVAAFAYRSLDADAAFFRQIVPGPNPAYVYTPKHEMLTQYGVTAAKDFGDFVIKAEAIYDVGKDFNTQSQDDGDGIVSQNFLDYIISAELPLPDDGRFNAQFFQRHYTNHDPNIIPSRIESGASLYWTAKYGRFEPQLLYIRSLNRNDYLARPKLIWNFAKGWRAVGGVDIFGGRDTGLFGQYDRQDRVYLEVRRSF